MIQMKFGFNNQTPKQPSGPGYYFFDKRTGQFLDYRSDLVYLEGLMVEYIDNELTNGSPYSHIADILNKKFGNLYLIYMDKDENKETLNVMGYAHKNFLECYVKHHVTLNLLLDLKALKMYKFNPQVSLDITGITLSDNRILCIMPYYILSSMWKDWFKQHVEKYAINDASETVMLFSEEDLNYVRLTIDPGYEPYVIRFKDIAQKLVDYGFPREEFL